MLKEGPWWNQLHYLFEDLSNLLAGDFLWGVGILEGLAVDGRELARGEGLCVWGTVSTSEHTDWISEMSKSDASLPRRLLALLPALLPARLPGRLGVFLGSANCVRTLVAAVVIKPLSSPEWKPFPDKYPGSRSLLPCIGVPSADGTEKSEHSAGLQGVDILLFVNHGLP